MKVWIILAWVAACGGGQHTDTKNSDPDPVPVYHDTRTPLEKRRDAACEHLQPKLTQCALTDAKATMSPKQLEDLRPEELLSAHKQKFLKECKGSAMSSRQVRVLEVCDREESACDPLAACLEHLEPEKHQGPGSEIPAS
ncbi:MAG: hypothetical protein ABI467_26605 [Kofleriaceae bacterium]